MLPCLLQPPAPVAPDRGSGEEQAGWGQRAGWALVPSLYWLLAMACMG